VEAADVLEIVDLLTSTGVRFWIDGGWGIDALVGLQTRPHLDLDLAIRTEDLASYLAAMIGAGFRTTRVDNPWNTVMTDRCGRQVDVHLVDFHAVVTGPDGFLVYGPNGLAYDVGAFGAAGWIGGRPVPCCRAGFQMRSHTGYELDDNDVHDVLLLHRQFGIPLPDEYSQFQP
jgi:lincosamide nucleotidyltransferase A/C/D/E